MTFNKKDVFSLVTAEEARAYIGKQGYFGDSLQELERAIKETGSNELVEVFPDERIDRVFMPQDYKSSYSLFLYGLFLPADKVKEEVED